MSDEFWNELITHYFLSGSTIQRSAEPLFGVELGRGSLSKSKPLLAAAQMVYRSQFDAGYIHFVPLGDGGHNLPDYQVSVTQLNRET